MWARYDGLRDAAAGRFQAGGCAGPARCCFPRPEGRESDACRAPGPASYADAPLVMSPGRSGFRSQGGGCGAVIEEGDICAEGHKVSSHLWLGAGPLRASLCVFPIL